MLEVVYLPNSFLFGGFQRLLRFLESSLGLLQRLPLLEELFVLAFDLIAGLFVGCEGKLKALEVFFEVLVAVH